MQYRRFELLIVPLDLHLVTDFNFSAQEIDDLVTMENNRQMHKHAR